MDNKFLDKSAYIRIPASEVKIGMFVVELDRPWLGTPFLTQGFVISSNSEIKKLRELCIFIYEEKAGRLWAGKQDPFSKENVHANAFDSGKPQTGIFNQAQQRKPSLVATINDRQPHLITHSFFEELPRAQKLYLTSRRAMTDLLGQARQENRVDMSLAAKLVLGLVRSVLRHPDPLLFLTHTKDASKYLLEHCLHMAIFSANFGRVLRLEEKDILRLAIHGLLADFGMIRLPQELLNKQEGLTQSERQLINSHPQLGREILMNSESGARFATDAVINHHERLDRKGYPRGIDARTLPQFSRIISIVDAYDAMTSPRVYAEEKSPLQALQQIYRNRGKQFDEEYALEFIHSIGPYPAGTLVELHNGAVAIVLTSAPKQRQLPLISILLGPDKQPQPPQRLDLSELDNEGKNCRDLMIQRVLRNGEYGINLMTLPLEALEAPVTAEPETDAEPDQESI
ncbi:MAG: DUF3391 domain-containing protein [Porticoccaceae bacterium]